MIMWFQQQQSRLLRWWRRPTGFAHEYLPDGQEIERAPMPWLARSTLYVLTLLVVLLVLWAALSHVDRIVTANGKIVTTKPSIVVQPLETAVIHSLNVEVGDEVRAGDTLAALDPTFVVADQADLAVRLGSMDAHLRRLRAELSDGPFEVHGDDPDEQVQGAILLRRRSEYRSRLQNYDEKAGQLESALLTNRQSQVGLTERVEVLREIEGMRSQLHEKQIGSRLNLLEAQSERLRLRDEFNALRNREREILHELAGTRAERDSFISEWQRKMGEEVVELTRQRATIFEQLAKADRRKTLVTLSAPVDAVVLEIAKRSVGSIVKDAEPLITLVPLGVPLEVEAEIVARDIAMVRIGDSVRLKLDAFPFQRHGTLPGEVRTITSDAFQHETKGSSDGTTYYRARIRVLSTQLEKVPANNRLTPGMVATAEIKVGTRSVLSYFLYPIIRAFDESIREP
ncbi:Membrane fusion protein (MFP) family protein [Azospirillaceae bacterium]